MRFLVTVIDSDWSIDPVTFVSALVQRWPLARIQEVPASDAYCLRWDGADSELAEGQLGRDGQTVGLEGTLEGASEVAAWFRELVPPQIGVSFFDQGYSTKIDVKAATNGQTLASMYLNLAAEAVND